MKRVLDIELQGQIHNKDEVKTPSLEKKEKKKRTTTAQVKKSIEKILRPERLLLVSCLLSVAVDPLFFYLPVINEQKNCIVLDRRLYIISICLRTVLDSISLVNIIWQCFHPSKCIENNVHQLQGQYGGRPVDEDAVRSKAKKSYSWSLAIEVLAILPIPQVLFPIMYSKMKVSQSWNGRKVLTIVVLFPYLPRSLRIYWLCKRVFLNFVSKTKAAFNLLLYINASHVFGGLWYFLSVAREIACWHLACENHECDRRSYFDCNYSSGNYTFLKDSCPIETSNTTGFDFGIFQEALQSGIMVSTDFPRKILYCFWWGLRNMSSFGSNLQTSTYFWENGFAVSIGILGLTMFMYFLGHLEMYMQRESKRQLKEDKKLRKNEKWRKYHDMETKKLKINDWIDRNQRLKEKRKLIMDGVDRTFEQNKDIDAENPLPHLPMFIRIEILHHLCAPLLQKVPLLQDAREDVLKLISRDFLKPMSYNENSYIAREGEPLDALLFITQGIVWTYTTRPNDHQTGCLKTDDFYGFEVLEWVFKYSPSLPDPSSLPFSTRTLRCHTKVQAFALTAGSTQNMLYHHWWKFRKFRVSGTDSNLEQLQCFAALKLQAAFRRRHNARQLNNTST